MEIYKVLVTRSGCQTWYQNGKLHRLDGPAVESRNGDKEWYQNGERHRLDGPAVESRNGDKEWYQNGKLHRLDGPAIEYTHGGKTWCIDDDELSEEEYNERTRTKELTVADLEAILGYSIKIIK